MTTLVKGVELVDVLLYILFKVILHLESLAVLIQMLKLVHLAGLEQEDLAVQLIHFFLLDELEFQLLVDLMGVLYQVSHAASSKEVLSVLDYDAFAVLQVFGLVDPIVINVLRQVLQMGSLHHVVWLVVDL